MDLDDNFYAPARSINLVAETEFGTVQQIDHIEEVLHLYSSRSQEFHLHVNGVCYWTNQG